MLSGSRHTLDDWTDSTNSCFMTNALFTKSASRMVKTIAAEEVTNPRPFLDRLSFF